MMYKESLSVAMCTYNGAGFIREQLESILDQQLPVDEIVICDDASTDRTLDIIYDIVQRSSVGIRVVRNEKNLGYIRNFEKAISLCRGDIIFLSDQDDRWVRGKTKAITEWFDAHPTQNVVFTNGTIIDAKGNSIGMSLFDRVGLTGCGLKRWNMDNHKIPILSIACRATGATMAFRRSFVPRFLPFVEDRIYIHDAQITIRAAEHECLGLINEPLIAYRIHEGQQTGFRRTSSPTFPYKKRSINIRIIEFIENPFYREEMLFFAYRGTSWPEICRNWRLYKKYTPQYFIRAMFFDIIYYTYRRMFYGNGL